MNHANLPRMRVGRLCVGIYPNGDVWHKNNPGIRCIAPQQFLSHVVVDVVVDDVVVVVDVDVIVAVVVVVVMYRTTVGRTS